MLRVTEVKPLENYRLKLTFSNGVERIFDTRPYLDRGIFRELKNVDYFKSVRIAYGTVTWPNEQDFGPESLFVESEPVTSAEPTEKSS